MLIGSLQSVRKVKSVSYQDNAVYGTFLFYFHDIVLVKIKVIPAKWIIPILIELFLPCVIIGV